MCHGVVDGLYKCLLLLVAKQSPTGGYKYSPFGVWNLNKFDWKYNYIIVSLALTTLLHTSCAKRCTFCCIHI